MGTSGVSAKPKLFLSYSFLKEDVAIVRFFSTIFGVNFDVIVGTKVPVNESLPAHLKGQIDQCNCFVAVVTRRREGTSALVTVESTFQYAKSHGRNTIVFIERHVHSNIMKTYRRLSVTEPVEFSRGNLPGILEKALQISHDLYEATAGTPQEVPTAPQFLPSPTGPAGHPVLVSLQAIKTVTVLLDGRGEVEYEHEIEVLSDGFDPRKHIKGGLWVLNTAPRKEGLPTVAKMLRNGLDSGQEPGLVVRVLSNGRNIRLGVEEFPLDRPHPEARTGRTFYLKPNYQLRAGEKMSFAWGWTCANVFVRRGQDNTGYHAHHPVRSLHLVLRFELHEQKDPWRFTSQPALSLFSARGDTKAHGLPGQNRLRLRYREFSWTGLQLGEGDQARVDWELD